MDMIRVLFGAISLYMVGYSVRTLIFRKSSAAVTHFEAISLDIGLGLGVSALVFFYAAFFGMKLTMPAMAGVLSPFWLIAAYFCVNDFRKHACQMLCLKMFRFPKMTFAQILLVATIILIILILLFFSLFLPMMEWTSRTVFDFKAKILLHEKTIYSDAILDPDRAHEHADYPLLVPLAENWFYNIMGHYNDRLVKIVFFLVGLALISGFYSVLRKFTNRTYALIFTVFLFSTDVLIYRTYSAEADMPLSFFYFIAGAYLYLWMNTESVSYFTVSAAFMPFIMLTKYEGNAFFAILLSCLFLFLCFDRKKSLRKKFIIMMLYAGVPLLMILPWFLFTQISPDVHVLIRAADFNPVNVVIQFSRNYTRTKEVVLYFVDQILIKREWHTFWILFLVSQIFFIRLTLRKPLFYLAINVWATLAVYYAMFIIIWVIPAHMLVGTGRFCLQVAPLAALLVALQIHKSGIFDSNALE